MSFKIPPRLLNMGKTLYTWSIRINKFIKHRFLTKRKNILIIGEEDTPLYMSLHPKLVKTWQITNLLYQEPPKQSQFLNQLQDKKQGKFQAISNDKQTKSQVISTDKQTKLQTVNIEKQTKPQTVSSDPKNKEKIYYKRLYIYNNNYNEIEKKLEGRQFDSIVVLPKPDETDKCFNIEDQAFITKYPQVHQELLMRNLFAYRLASKYLTSSGVMILSGSERDFIKQTPASPENDLGNSQQKSISIERKWWDSNQIIDAQISYLGVVIGDRDYTDLNSWIVVALSKQTAEENPELVADYYRLWADSQSLPMPGSFALFRLPSTSIKQNYVQYL